MNSKGPHRFFGGAVLGLIILLSIVAVLDSGFDDELKKVFIEVMGILAALVAAFFALHGVQRQIAAQEAHHERQRLDDLRAARPLLVLVLSNLHQKANDAISTLVVAPGVGDRSEAIARLARISAVSSDQIQILKDSIRASDHESAAWLSLIIGMFQVCCARTEVFLSTNQRLSENNRINYIMNWCEFRAAVGHCFAYSRGEELKIPQSFSASDIRVPLAVLRQSSALFRQLEETLRSRWESSDRDVTCEDLARM